MNKILPFLALAFGIVLGPLSVPAQDLGVIPLAESFGLRPVEFTVEADGPDVLLSWSFAGETGLVGFDLYRTSSKATAPERINPSFLYDPLEEGGHYEYRDTPPAAGKFSYQIEWIFTDGSRRRSEPVALDYQPPPQPAAREPDAPRYRATALPQPDGLAEQAATAAAEIRQAEMLRSPRTGARLKITVREEGLYHLDADLLAEKFGATPAEVREWIGKETLRLSSQGVQCSWIPAPDNAGLFFYNPGYEDFYTLHNVFWLESDSYGLVVPPVQDEWVEGPAQPHVAKEARFEEQKLWLYLAFRHIPLDDYWFWARLQAAPVETAIATNFAFEVDRIDPDGPDAELSIRLQGGSNSGVANEHFVNVYLNETHVGSASWSANETYEGTFSVPVGMLAEGSNQLGLAAILQPEIPHSVVYLDRYSVKFRMLAMASNNYLRMESTPAGNFEVTGLTGTNALAIEVLDRHRIRAAGASRVDLESDGSYSIRFAARASANQGYAVGTPDGAWEPLLIEATPASALRATSNAVDYLIVTHPILELEAQRLADFRAERHPGLRPRIVLVDEIFNEFAHGLQVPEAITRFLAYAYNHWQETPHYVLFAGSASYDYKNYLGYNENLVPCLFVHTPHNRFSSDNSLADVVGQDGVPEFAIGRIPASTSAAMSAVVDKILLDELGGFRPNRVLLTAGLPDSGGNFWASADNMTNHISTDYVFEKAYVGYGPNSSASAIRTAIRNSINGGVAQMVYFGHSALDYLAGKILATDNIANLTNSPNLPVLLLMSCWPNRFEVPGRDSIGQAMVLLDPHGAVASWGPSGMSYNSQAETYARYFLEAQRDNPEWRLGDLARAATERASQNQMPRFMLDIMILLGDPMTSSR